MFAGPPFCIVFDADIFILNCLQPHFAVCFDVLLCLLSTASAISCCVCVCVNVCALYCMQTCFVTCLYHRFVTTGVVRGPPIPISLLCGGLGHGRRHACLRRLASRLRRFRV